MPKQDQLIAMTSIDVTLTPGQAADRSKGTPAVRPKVQTIRAGTIFVAQSEEQQDDLINRGAARKATKADIPTLQGVVDLAEATESAIVSGQRAAATARETEAERIKAQAAEIGEAELRRQFEAEIGEPAPANMRPATMLKRIEEVRFEKERGGPTDENTGRPVAASGSTETARSTRNDTSTPAAEQTGNTAAPDAPSTTTKDAETGTNKAGTGGKSAKPDDDNLV